MIRQVLPFDSHPSIVALDAALRRGDLLFVRNWLLEQEKESVRSGSKENSGELISAQLLREAAYAYLASRHQKVLTRIDELFALHPPPTTDAALAAQLLRGLACIDLKQPKEAEHALAQVEEEADADSPLLHYVWLARATLALYMSRYEDAKAHILHYLTTSRGDVWAQWQSLRLRGLVAHQETNHVEAQDLLTNAREGFATLGDRYETARCDKALANTYRRLDDEDKAITHAQAAVEYFRSQKLTIPLARCLNTLGAILLYFNQVEIALTHFREAALHLETSGLRPELAHTVANMGLCYSELGHMRLAMRAYERARELVANPHLPYSDATIAMYQASLYWLNGENDLAIRLVLEAIRLFEQVGVKTQLALCWRKLGSYLMESGQLDEASARLTQSHKIFSQHRAPTQAALVSVLLGRLQLLRGNFDQAIALLKTGADVLREHHRGHEAATADAWLGELFWKQGEYDKALAAFKQALNSAPSARLKEAWRAWQGLARIAYSQGDLERSLVYYQRAITHVDRLRRSALSPHGAARLARETATLYEEALSLALQFHQANVALRMLEEQKAVQLMERLRPRPNETESEFMPGFSQLRSIGGYATRLQGLRAGMHDAWSKEEWTRLSRLEQEFQQITQKMDALNAPYAGLFETKPLDIDGLRTRLNEQCGRGRWGCLVYGWLEERASTLHRFWLDSDALLAHPAPLTNLEHHLLRLGCHPEPSYRRKLLNWSDPAHAPREWRHLQELLLPDTFRPRLAEVQTLFIAPSGALAAFPFAALDVGGRYLGLSFDLTQIPSLPMLDALLRRSDAPERARTPLSKMRGLVCAISDFPHHAHVSHLPMTQDEAGHLTTRLASESLLLKNGDATLEAWRALQQGDALAEFALLHFATHVRFHPYHGRLSHILLNDGALYVSDVLNWRLNARLVTLAACDTAVGQVLPGDEQMGLPHAFLVAGADAVVASLWPVSDEATATFLKRFYEALETNAPTPAAALRLARTQTYTNAPCPIDWGAFVVIGPG